MVIIGVQHYKNVWTVWLCEPSKDRGMYSLYGDGTDARIADRFNMLDAFTVAQRTADEVNSVRSNQ